VATRSAFLGSYKTAGAREGFVLYANSGSNVTIVKSVLVFSSNPGTVDVQVYVTTPHGTGTGYLHVGSIAQYEQLTLEHWVVMEADAVLVVWASAADIHFYASGAILPPR
jgi:hypothetical protein